jgi:hypothetical protein
LKPIEITLETSGCGRAWTNVQAGVNSSKHFPQTRLGKHYSRQKSSDTADQKKKNLGHIQNRWQELQSEFVFWMEKQLPRQPLCLKLKKQNRRTKKPSET